MTSNRKVALLVGAATCLGAMIYAAPIFGADDSTMTMSLEPLAMTESIPDNELMMAPLRREAKAALAKLQTAIAAAE